jgi:hypothetical protein
VGIEKEVEVLRNEGGDTATVEFEEYTKHLNLIFDMSV